MKLRIVKDPATRRTEILDHAYKLFTERGYERTSINQIICSIGFSKGALYHHFSSKEELLEAITSRLAGQIAEDARSILEDPSLDAFARLTAFLAHLRARKVEQVAEMREMFEPIFRADNVRLFHRIHAAITAVVQPILAKIIADGVAERTFDTPDPDTAATLIIQLGATGRELIAEAMASPTLPEREHLIDRLCDRLDYLGTVVDRILGIPEGSIKLSDRADLRQIVRMMVPSANAA
jgi:AcrR family transcriptional regulator